MRFAIVGTNFISDNFAQAAARVEGAELAAVYSRTAARGEEFAKKQGIPKVYTSYEQLLLDGDIDAVYVASPTVCHAEQSILAMKAGKHVLCEKMIADSLEGFLAMKETAREQGCVLLEAMRPDFDPAMQLVRELLPKLGVLRRASLEFCQYSSRYDRFLSGEVLNAFDPGLKNSALADIGIYPLHACAYLFGEPKELFSRSVFLKNGFEGAGSLLLDYGDMLATVSYSKITQSVNPSVIEGELGSLTIDKISAPGKIILHMRGDAPRAIPYTPRENNMVYEIAAFLAICRGDRSADEYLRATEISMRCVDRAYRLSGIRFPEQ